MLNSVQNTRCSETALATEAAKAFAKLPGEKGQMAEQAFQNTGKINVPQPRLQLDNTFTLSDLPNFSRCISACHDKRNLVKPKVSGLTPGPISLPFGYAREG